MSDIIIIPLGKSVPLSPSDSAFAHGFGIFETMHYADGQIDFWHYHWARLSKSARYFALPLPAENAVLSALRTHVCESALDQGILKISLMKESVGSQLYVYSREQIAAPSNRRLRLDESCPIFDRSTLVGHKTHNYMEAMHLMGLARNRGDYDILRVDSKGHLAETTSANFFFVKGGHIHTPALETGILPGVTRTALLSYKDLEIKSGLYTPKTLLDAEAVFVTNASSGVQLIEQLYGLPNQETIHFSTDAPTISLVQSAFTSIRADHATQLI